MVSKAVTSKGLNKQDTKEFFLSKSTPFKGSNSEKSEESKIGMQKKKSLNLSLFGIGKKKSQNEDEEDHRDHRYRTTKFVDPYHFDLHKIYLTLELNKKHKKKLLSVFDNVV
jgi:hypothetical protein